MGKDQFATLDILLQSRIVAVTPLAMFGLALPQDPYVVFPLAPSTLAIAVRHILGSLWNSHSTPLAPMFAIVDIS
jgi:hypothetical protein